jgi:hypothetical protein
MTLTAREWLLMPADEQEQHKQELSPHECYLLRTLFSNLHFSEEEKRIMPEAEREKFLHPKEFTEAERSEFSRQCKEIFTKLSKEAKR